MNPDLEELDRKIRAAKGEPPSPLIGKVERPPDSEARAGIQAGVELVAAIGAGAAIGYGLDSWLGTKPAFFLIFFFLGICTGFYNVYRVTQNLGSAVGFSALHKRLRSEGKNARTPPDSQNSD
ncbi:MAG: AtpZ/AtpI family protein [Alphaproteobacteria bacterium]|nr:AtpZ/AtpI family protein [Alphaproteobacteria bacterium]